MVQQWFHEHPLDADSALYPEHSKQALTGAGGKRGKSKRGGKRRKGKARREGEG